MFGGCPRAAGQLQCGHGPIALEKVPRQRGREACTSGRQFLGQITQIAAAGELRGGCRGHRAELHQHMAFLL